MTVALTKAWSELITEVAERLAANRQVRRRLPTRGRLHIDRQLPFLVVHRRREGEGEVEGAARLVETTGSYLVAPARRGVDKRLARLVRAIVETQVKAFGAFLLLELWVAPRDEADGDAETTRPTFTVHVPKSRMQDDIVVTLTEQLGKLRLRRRRAAVSVDSLARTTPPGLPRLIVPPRARALGCFVIGLEVAPVWADRTSGELYPLVLRALARQLSRALHRTFFTFACNRTTQYPTHYHALGRRAMVRAVWEVDGQLAGVSKAFDFLLMCTPVNVESAWESYRRKEQVPTFRYRPLPVEPALLKRRLFDVPLEAIEDPALDRLFREKQLELDRQLTMLLDRQTRRFLPGSQALYGGAGPRLVGLATDLLARLPPPAASRRRQGELDSKDVLRLARKELAIYRRRWPALVARASIRDDYPAGMLVSQGQLLIGKDTRLSPGRVDALLQHEVGTHVLTYENGRAQPFQLLAAGLAGYEELQEGLAVLAEHLVGGLTPGRLRVLAARVVSVASLLDGADYVETCRLLVEQYGFDRRAAFGIAMRVYRAGGLTKDAIYLRGLKAALAYLAAGEDLDPLLVGKIAVAHVGIVEELTHRRVLKPPPLRPRYLDRDDVVARLQELRSGATVLDLAETA